MLNQLSHPGAPESALYFSTSNSIPPRPHPAWRTRGSAFSFCTGSCKSQSQPRPHCYEININKGPQYARHTVKGPTRMMILNGLGGSYPQRVRCRLHGSYHHNYLQVSRSKQEGWSSTGSVAGRSFILTMKGKNPVPEMMGV